MKNYNIKNISATNLKQIKKLYLFNKCLLNYENTCIIYFLFYILNRPDEITENLYLFKSTLFILVASVYSTQLTFTTLCTPVMIYEWFLIIKDCRLIYSNVL